jgi:hypothetical protein
VADPLAYWKPCFDPRKNMKVVFFIRDPTPYDNDFELSQQWLNITTKNLFALTGRQNRLAVWEQVDNLDASMTDGQIQVGSTGNPPVATTLTAGANITITNNPGSITISANNPLAPQQFYNVTGNTTLEINAIFYVAALSTVDLTLPIQYPLGYTTVVLGRGANYVIKQNPGQIIHFHSMSTTMGTSGEIQSTTQFDCITLTCVEENNVFVIHPSTGNFNLV